MNKALKKTLAVVLVLLMTTSLFACAAPQAEPVPPAVETTAAPVAEAEPATEEPAAPVGEKTQITFWTTNKSEFSDLVAAFEEANPDIDVVTAYQGGYDDMYQKIQMSVMTGDTPCVAQMGERYSIATLADANLLVPMNEVLSEEAMNDILPVFKEHFSYKGNVVAMPFCCSVPVMFYNVTLFEKYGVEIPQTWDELVEAAAKLTIDEDKDGINEVWGFSFDDAPASYLKSYILDQGASIVQEDNTVNVNSEAAVNTYKWVQNMVFENKCMAANQYLSSYQDFGAGKIAMLFAASACYSWIGSMVGEQFEYATAMLPAAADGTRFVMLGGNALGIFKSTPEQEAASAKLVEFLISTENTAENSMASGYVPVRQSAIDSESYKTFVAENPAWQIAQDEMAYICPVNINPADTVLWNGLIEAMERVSDNAKTKPEDVVPALQKTLDEFFASYEY